MQMAKTAHARKALVITKVASIATAPNVAPMGKAGPKGAHHNAACTKGSKATLLALLQAQGATVTFTNPGVTPWRANSNGALWYAKCVMPLLKAGNTITVAAIAQSTKAASFTVPYPHGYLGHLIWLYTWANGGMQVNGGFYAVAK
jgi:hypothetical protein